MMESESRPQVPVGIYPSPPGEPVAVTVPTAAVPLELLRQYSSPNPLRRGPRRGGAAHTGRRPRR